MLSCCKLTAQWTRSMLIVELFYWIASGIWMLNLMFCFRKPKTFFQQFRAWRLCSGNLAKFGVYMSRGVETNDPKFSL